MLRTSILLLLLQAACGAKHSEEELQTFFGPNGQYENDTSHRCTIGQLARWNYQTDINKDNSEKMVKSEILVQMKQNEVYVEWFKDLDLSAIKDPTIKRRVKLITMNIGSSVLEKEDVKNLTEILSRMTDTYSTGKVCPYSSQDCDLKRDGLSLNPDLEKLFISSRNYDELSYLWKAWRDETGKKMADDYKQYVELENKAAKINGFKDYGDSWRAVFETPHLNDVVDKLWKQISPLYDVLHNFTRAKLVEVYGAEKLGDDGLIPAHILGNMWAQEWDNLEFLIPYPNVKKPNITKALLEQGYTPQKMFETANNFYQSLGLPNAEMSYGPGAMILKPTNKDVQCHASAWDFCDNQTYRISMCTEVDENNFGTIHHEMGHIIYFLLYANQPADFRDGANPAFHEAIGDTISLSVLSSTHLVKLKLMNETKGSKEADINQLMTMALSKIVFMPYSIVLDKWRWDVFADKVPFDKWNDLYWHLRKTYQKVKPPVPRNNTDFDPGAKMHIGGDSQYISYFLATVLQFQFYRSLCITAGQYDPKTRDPPLYKCDFYQSKEAGDKLRAGLSLGSSKPWEEVLQALTGESNLDAGAILEYFEPLAKHLNPNSGAYHNVMNNYVTLICLTFVIIVRYAV